MDNPAETKSALLSLTATACDRNREHSPLIDFHTDLFEARSANELIHFGRRPATHDPAFTFAIGQHLRDELELRMPRLIRVNEVTARLNRVG
jgi:hypothetical protein